MKVSVKCLIVILSSILVFSMAGCGSGVNKEEVAAEAESVLEEITSLNAKKMDKRNTYDEEYIEMINSFSQEKFSKRTWEKAIIEVDENSVQTKDGLITCEATVKCPNYEKALRVFEETYYDDTFDDEDEMYDALLEILDDQKKREYISFVSTLEFEKNDGLYILVNGDDLIEDVMGDYLDMMDEIVEGYEKKARKAIRDIKKHEEEIDAITSEIDAILGN
ncbi:MAG: hypothetical protein IKR22_06410 [Clostridiales bacterium]|nr:hypothetical protein [Clostridiales bacterium]